MLQKNKGNLTNAKIKSEQLSWVLTNFDFFFYIMKSNFKVIDSSELIQSAHLAMKKSMKSIKFLL